MRSGMTGQQRCHLGRQRRFHRRLRQREHLGCSSSGCETRYAPVFQRRDEGRRGRAGDIYHDLDALDVLWDV